MLFSSAPAGGGDMLFNSAPGACMLNARLVHGLVQLALGRRPTATPDDPHLTGSIASQSVGMTMLDDRQLLPTRRGVPIFDI